MLAAAGSGLAAASLQVLAAVVVDRFIRPETHLARLAALELLAGQMAGRLLLAQTVRQMAPAAVAAQRQERLAQTAARLCMAHPGAVLAAA